MTTNPADAISTWKAQLTEETQAHQATRSELDSLKAELSKITSSRDAFLGGFKTPVRIISIVDVNPDGKELVVGWDTCGQCLHHIRICECAGGPTEPNYIKKFRTESLIPERFGIPVTTSAVSVESADSKSDASVPSDSSTKCKVCGEPAESTNADADDSGALVHYQCQEA